MQSDQPIAVQAVPHNSGFKFRMLRRLAGLAQKYHPKGIDRLLRAVYSPDRRQHDRIEIVLEYDDDLLMHIDTGSFIEWTIFFYGHYEPEITRLIKRIVRKGNVAIDVGANIGCHALVMGRAVGETGRVIAVEPNPTVHARLADNIRLNRMKHVLPLQRGLSFADSESTLYIPPSVAANQGMSSIYPQALLSERVTVKIETLDGVMKAQGCDRLDFVKIDTQGNDFNVLRGAEQSIRQHLPYLLFEFDHLEWGISHADFHACQDFFSDMQYSLYVLHRSGILTNARHGVGSCANILAVPPRD